MDRKKKIALSIITTLSFVLILFILISVLISRFNYEYGLKYIREKDYNRAEKHLVKALEQLPFNGSTILTTIDLFRIHSGLGKIYYKNAYQSENAQEYYNRLIESERNYRLAIKYCPIAYEPTLGMAYVTASLEGVGSERLSESPPHTYNALPFYERAVSLWPNGITVNYARLKYLARSCRTDLIPDQIRKVAFIYPSAWGHLQKEPFYKEEYKEYIIDGLNLAIQENHWLRSAHAVLSDIYEKEGNYAEAVREYELALKQQPRTNLMWNYIHMGRLYLKNSEKEAAFEQFVKAVNLSKKRDDCINQIYSLFKREKQLGSFIELVEKLRRKGVKDKIASLCEARAWIGLDNLERAEAILKALNEEDSIAESYYLLATINRERKDWDSMELNSHRAMASDQANHRYHKIFSQALNYQGKYPQAEEAITEAIRLSENKNPWYHNQRGWIRLSRKNYKGAVDDWRESIRLKPEIPNFYYSLSLAYRKMQDYDSALVYAVKANELKLEDRVYKMNRKEIERLIE